MSKDIKKIWDQILKAKTEKKISWPQKSVWNKNLKKNISSYFSFIFALKTVDAQMLFWSIFFLVTKLKLITAKNGQNGIL